MLLLLMTFSTSSTGTFSLGLYLSVLLLVDPSCAASSRSIGKNTVKVSCIAGYPVLELLNKIILKIPPLVFLNNFCCMVRILFLLCSSCCSRKVENVALESALR